MRSLKGITFISICLVLAFFMGPLFAAPTGARIESVPGFQPVLKKSYALGLISDQYYFFRSSTPAFGESEHADRLVTVGAKLQLNSTQAVGDVAWFFSEQEKQNYVSIAELGWRKSFDGYSILLGRHKSHWSLSDEFWQLGLWQPQFTWDQFQVQQQGFTGVFGQFQLPSQLLATTFFSPLFVPSYGVLPQEEDRRIVSKNPWMKTSPPEAKLWGETSPVFVDLEMPSTESILFQPSVAFALKKEWSENHFTQMAYAYKPLNSEVLEYEFYVRSRPGMTDTVDVTARPSFPYHEVLTLEQFIGDWGGWDWTFSTTYDQPFEKKAIPERITQDIVPSMQASLQVSRPWDVYQPNRGRIYFGALRVWSDRPMDQGIHAQPKSQFLPRILFDFAVRLGSERVLLLNRGRRVVAQTEVTYDFFQRAAMGRVGLDFAPVPNLLLGADLRLIGATSESSHRGAYEENFMREFRANDSAGVHVSYFY